MTTEMKWLQNSVQGDEETSLSRMPRILLQKIGNWTDVFHASVSVTGLILFWQKYSQEGGQEEKKVLLQCYFFPNIK